MGHNLNGFPLGMRIKRHEHNVWKGLVAGLAGGLVASWAMNQFQSTWSKKVYGMERSPGAQSLQQGSPDHGLARNLKENGSDQQSDEAPMRMASSISENVFGHKLAEGEKHAGGAVAHYAMGATSGGIYGAMAEVILATTVEAGTPFGAAGWLVADEVIVPVLGLSKSSKDYPFSIHAYAFTSHLVYGVATELVRGIVRRAL